MTFTAVVVTVSDSVSLGDAKDISGACAEEILAAKGFELRPRRNVPDEGTLIGNLLINLIGQGVDLIVTTGGTGFGPRDVTPEATRSVVDREAPGLAELMRAEGRKKTPMAALSRGIVGSRSKTLIVNLPGSPKAVEESLEALSPVLPHALETLCGYTAHPHGTPSPE
jgi:molybdenum cofactor synthesis domain-containing protein